MRKVDPELRRVTMGVSLSRAEREKVEELARLEGRSVSSLIRKALIVYCETKEDRTNGRQDT